MVKIISKNDKKLFRYINNYGVHNTGVNIEPYILQIILKVSIKERRRILSLFLKNKNIEAMSELNKLILDVNISQKAKDMLSRVLSVCTYANIDFPLPEKSTEQLYCPKKGHILYLLHMRAPIIQNGYASRSGVILDAIIKSGHTVFGVTRPGFPNELQAYRHVNIKPIEKIDDIVFHALSDYSGNLINTPIDRFILNYANELIDLAKDERPEIIHAASNYINGIAAVIAGRKLGICSVYEVRGLWHVTKESKDISYKYTLKYALEKKMEIFAVKEADRVIVISEGLKQYFVREGVDESKLLVVPNGVDGNKFFPVNKNIMLANKLKIKNTDVVIGYVGSIVDYEGIDLVLKAVHTLIKRSVHNVKLLIVGGGVAEEPLKKLMNDLGVQDVCIFAGLVPKDEVIDYYSLIDIAPFARKSLPVTKIVSPLKPMEAMAMGCSVVVSDLPALIDIGVDGESILHCTADDYNSLADAFYKLIVSGDLRAVMGNNARQWVLKNRSIDQLSELIRASYE